MRDSGVNELRIIVDAMGGDNAPDEIVKGCVDAVYKSTELELVMLGDKGKIEDLIHENIRRFDPKHKFDPARITVVHTSEVINNEDSPTKSIRTKKDSSIVVGLTMLKEKKGDVFISAGNTGALLTGALLMLGRIPGVDRPALAPVIPTKTGGTMLIDAGLNTNCKPINYLQFGIIGSIYMREIFKINNPRVGLINNGAEESKGTDVIKQAYQLLSNANINFIGNVEGRQIPLGEVDVAVCDGFVGNVVLKFLEGVGSYIISGIRKIYSKTLFSKFSALIVKEELKKFFKQMDYEEYGGTPILGVNGMVFKCHGSSKAKAIRNAVLKANEFAKSPVMEIIRKEFENMEVEIDD